MVSSSSDSSRDSVRGGALVAFRMACESAWCLSALYIMSSTLCTAPALLQCSHMLHLHMRQILPCSWWRLPRASFRLFSLIVHDGLQLRCAAVQLRAEATWTMMAKMSFAMRQSAIASRTTTIHMDKQQRSQLVWYRMARHSDHRSASIVLCARMHSICPPELPWRHYD